MPRDLLTALSLLPGAYGEAMRLRIEGASPADVAEALDLDGAAVIPLLHVADAKLRELMLADDPPKEGDAP